MAIPPQRDPLEFIIKESSPAESSQGEVLTHKLGIFSKVQVLLRTPLEPVPIPFPATGMILGVQRIRLQGVVSGYDAENKAALISKRFPSSGGTAAGMNALCSYIITRVQKHISRVPVELIVGLVETEIAQEWGLLCNLTLLPDQPDTVHSRVVVPCNIRGWPIPVNIMHEITLKQVDPVRAASVGRMTDEKLREWANARLKSVTQTVFAKLSMDEVVRLFGNRGDSLSGAQYEDSIKAPISALAKESLGYEVDIYTMRPELGLGEISHGFHMEVSGDYRTKDYAHGTPFKLITSFKVVLGDLAVVLQRKWLDAANPRQNPVEAAAKDLQEPVRRAVQRALNKVDTYTLLTQLDGAADEGGVQTRVLEEVAGVFRELGARIEDLVMLRPMDDKFSEFVGQITRECHGHVQFYYKKGTPDEIGFKATYHVTVEAKNTSFNNFFHVSFNQLGNAAKVKERIESELAGYAHQFLQQGSMLSRDAMIQLISAPPENVKHAIFHEAFGRFESTLGLVLHLGPLERTLPHREMENEKQARVLAEKMHEFRFKAIEAQGEALKGISAPDVIKERLDAIQDEVTARTESNQQFQADIAKLTSPPKNLLEGPDKKEDDAPEDSVKEN